MGPENRNVLHCSPGQVESEGGSCHAMLNKPPRRQARCRLQTRPFHCTFGHFPAAAIPVETFLIPSFKSKRRYHQTLQLSYQLINPPPPRWLCPPPGLALWFIPAKFLCWQLSKALFLETGLLLRRLLLFNSPLPCDVNCGWSGMRWIWSDQCPQAIPFEPSKLSNFKLKRPSVRLARATVPVRREASAIYATPERILT